MIIVRIIINKKLVDFRVYKSTVVAIGHIIDKNSFLCQNIPKEYLKDEFSKPDIVAISDEDLEFRYSNGLTFAIDSNPLIADQM